MLFIEVFLSEKRPFLISAEESFPKIGLSEGLKTGGMIFREAQQYQ